jgi:flagella basal body P-ring formation protein FlgA
MSFAPRNLFMPSPLLASPAQAGWCRLRLMLCAVVWILCVPLLARAQAQAPDYPALALKWARQVVTQSQDPAQRLRMEVTVGALDSRLTLAPCGNVETYLPPGARLWGHGRVGLRCVDGMARWNVTVPVTVRAFGAAWVVRGQVLAGNPLTQNDVVAAEVDWAEDSSPVLQDSAQWLGQTASRTLVSGQVLRQGVVRPTQVFQAGTQVRVVAEGPGFQVSSDAQALAAGVVGQLTRVRMDNGRIASGMVLDARTVKIDL